MNKKLIKTIAGITCGLGMLSPVLFVITSCGPGYKWLPQEAYSLLQDVDTHEVSIDGFSDDFKNNPNDYASCNTINLSKDVIGDCKSVAEGAFSIGIDQQRTTTIPNNLHYLLFNSDQRIESNITSIGKAAFFGAPFDDYVIMPFQIKEVGFSAFESCKKMQYLSFINADNCIIGDHAFLNCSSLKSVIFDGVSKIGINAFKECEQLDLITFSSTNIDALLNIEFDSGCFSNIKESGTVFFKKFYNWDSNPDSGMYQRLLNFVHNKLGLSGWDIDGTSII